MIVFSPCLLNPNVLSCSISHGVQRLTLLVLTSHWIGGFFQ